MILNRAEEVFGYFGESWQGERLQDCFSINQIIQKTSQDVQLIWHCPHHQVLPPRSLRETSAALSANSPRGRWERWGQTALHKCACCRDFSSCWVPDVPICASHHEADRWWWSAKRQGIWRLRPRAYPWCDLAYNRCFRCQSYLLYLSCIRKTWHPYLDPPTYLRSLQELLSASKPNRTGHDHEHHHSHLSATKPLRTSKKLYRENIIPWECFKQSVC